MRDDRWLSMRLWLLQYVSNGLTLVLHLDMTCLAQNCDNSIAIELELRKSCAMPSIWDSGNSSTLAMGLPQCCADVQYIP